VPFKHDTQDSFQSHRMTAESSLSEEITLAVPFAVLEINVVGLMLPRERDFELDEADPLWLLSILLGFGDDFGVGRRIHVFASQMGLWPVRPERLAAKSTAAR
jgi:hypothetical protein